MMRVAIVTLIAVAMSAALACGNGQRGAGSRTSETAPPGSATPSSTPASLDDELRALLKGAASKKSKTTSSVSVEVPLGDAGDETPANQRMDGTASRVQSGDGDYAESNEITAGWAREAGPMRLYTFVRKGAVTLCADTGGSALIFGLLPANACVQQADANGLKAAAEIADPSAQFIEGDLTVKGTSHRAIAGVVASCYDASFSNNAAGIEGEVELCFSDDGILLAKNGTGTTADGPVTFHEEATSVSRDVANADFALPYPLRVPVTLRVRNDTGNAIYVDGSDAGSDRSDGQITIDSGDEGTLRAGLFGDPASVGIGSNAGFWSFSCNWEDAKAHEPIVVTGETVPGPNGTKQVRPHANCTMTRYEPGLAPTPLPTLSRDGPGAAPIQLPRR